jgi:ribitol-5-phosphate 2-dehydrogenase (NADP+) / D-ribitol-5-phosphate cytidylyltransferase
LNYALLLASGEGSRFGGEKLKQLTRVSGKTILEHTLAVFNKSSYIDEIVIVGNAQVLLLADSFKEKYTKLKLVVPGGSSRTESTWMGLSSLSHCAKDSDKVLIHDGVRPFLAQEIIKNLVHALDSYDAVNTIIDATDTMLEVEGNVVVSIPDRNKIKRGQTPQGFRYGGIVEAFKDFLQKKDAIKVTDDCAIYLQYWGERSRIFTVRGSEENIKITFPFDLITAEEVFRMGRYGESQPTHNIKGRTAVVFGGSQGIGEALVKRLKQEGLLVHSFSRSSGCDVRLIKQVQQSLNSIDTKIDFIVNAAGVLYTGRLVEHSSEKIDEMLQTNITGSINIAKLAYPFLKKSKGMLVFFSSSSYLKGRANIATYSATKSAVSNLTQALAEEWAQDLVRVNCIAPSRTNTPMRAKNFSDSDDLADLLDPEIVATRVVETLKSEITGSVVRVF